ncbi:MAG: hypothetical protein OQK82_09055 [Candidatus Pacearchaeota archaeon]|nr:hypothetical protein [Candidatus Pacearchaeota archaeon]
MGGRFILEKFIFPKILIINNPGIIINKTVSRFGKTYRKTRVIYNFEEIAVELYKKTVNKIGKEKTDDLWYKIGKDGITRYFLFANMPKISEYKSKLLIECMFSTLFNAGMTFCKNINYDFNKKSLITKGDKNVICSKTHSGSLVAGYISGILSSILKKNIETKILCNNCPSECKFLAHPKIPKKYIPNFETLKPSKEYYKLNFPKEMIEGSYKFISFNDLLKFKKIRIDNKRKIFRYLNEIIIPSEIGLTSVILNNYKKIGEIEFANEVIISTSYNIAKKIFVNNDKDKNIKSLIGLLSAFGWGLPYIKKIGNKIIIDFIYPPKAKFGAKFNSLVLNGYLNYIFGKNLKPHIISSEKMVFKFY